MQRAYEAALLALRGLLAVRLVALDKLGPEVAPVVRAQFAARDLAAGQVLDGHALGGRHWPMAGNVFGDPIGDVHGENPQRTGQLGLAAQDLGRLLYCRSCGFSSHCLRIIGISYLDRKLLPSRPTNGED